MNREDWLDALVALLRPVLLAHGATVPEVAISVGFPKGSGGRQKAIGQCWNASLAADGRPQVFIHPQLADGVEVAAVVLHEIIHAAPESNPAAKNPHGRAFATIAKAMGLEGKMTATTPSDLTRDMLARMIETIGEPYPHGALQALRPLAKQSTRMLKAVCERDHDAYVVRLAKSTAERGLPACGECGQPMALDDPI